MTREFVRLSRHNTNNVPLFALNWELAQSLSQISFLVRSYRRSNNKCAQWTKSEEKFRQGFIVENEAKGDSIYKDSIHLV